MVALVIGAGFVGGAFRPVGPTPSPSPSPTATPSPGQTEVPSPSLPAPISVTADATITTAGPIAMASDGESLWVLAEGGRIDRLDPATELVADTLSFGGKSDQYNGLAWNEAGYGRPTQRPSLSIDSIPRRSR